MIYLGCFLFIVYLLPINSKLHEGRNCALFTDVSLVLSIWHVVGNKYLLNG